MRKLVCGQRTKPNVRITEMEIRKSGKLLASSLVPRRPGYSCFYDISPFPFYKPTQIICTDQ